MTTSSCVFGDAALNDAEQIRRQNAEFSQEIQQDRQLQQDYQIQNSENQELNNQINEDGLLLPTPQTLWNNGSEF